MPRECPVCASVYTSDSEFCAADGARLSSGDAFIGRTLGRFEVLGLLGGGAHGSVYRAHDRVTHDEVALKILKNASSSRADVRRFEREAAAIRAIRHPNVVSIVDFGTEGRVLFLAMELVRGRTLAEVLDRDGALAPQRAIEIAIQIASALEHAHRAGFVHRDLKPGNVMLVDRDGAEEVRVVDFGVAGTVEGDAPSTRLTREGHTVGTPAYMAPEQVFDSSVGPAADIYALGIVLYEMLTGSVPFTGTIGEVALKQVVNLPAPLPPLGGLAELVGRMLEKRPDRRLADAAEVADELREIASGIEITKVGTTPPRPTIEVVTGDLDPTETTDRRPAPLVYEAHDTSELGVQPVQSTAARPIAAAILAIALLGGGLVLYRHLNRSSPIAIAPAERPATTTEPAPEPGEAAAAGADRERAADGEPREGPASEPQRAREHANVEATPGRGEDRVARDDTSREGELARARGEDRVAREGAPLERELGTTSRARGEDRVAREEASLDESSRARGGAGDASSARRPRSQRAPAARAARREPAGADGAPPPEAAHAAAALSALAAATKARGLEDAELALLEETRGPAATLAAARRSGTPEDVAAAAEALASAVTRAQAGLGLVRARLDRVERELQRASLPEARREALYVEYLDLRTAARPGLTAETYERLAGQAAALRRRIETGVP